MLKSSTVVDLPVIDRIDDQLKLTDNYQNLATTTRHNKMQNYIFFSFLIRI